MVVQIKREINEVSRYKEVKSSKVTIGLNDTANESSQIIYTDILFNIYKIETLTKPKATVYNAYAVMINMSMEAQGNMSYVGGINIYNLNNSNMTNPNPDHTNAQT